MHLDAILLDLALIFGVAVAVVLGLARVGLPPVAGYIAAGILVGPGGLGLVAEHARVESLAELGVALLLFTIGLEFSLDRLRSMGRSVALGGGAQVASTVLAALALGWAAGLAPGASIFWGYAAALSSTAIVLRALADREEIAAPHGRFVVAVLIFQDLCIVPMMLTLPLLGGGGGSAATILATLAKSLAMLAAILVAARWIVPRVLLRVAATRRRELFVLSVLFISIVVAVGTAALGLSVALGAFLAGVIIADTEFLHQAAADVAPFRDALASVFFVSIGMLFDPAAVVAEPGLVLGGVALLVGSKLALATAAALVLRFPARVALVAGLSLAQVGEFSFVLVKSGEGLGLVEAHHARLFIAASVITMFLAPLAVAASPRLGAAGARLLQPLERLWMPAALPAPLAEARLEGHVVVAGLGVAGQLLATALRNAGAPYVGIDLNPDTVIRLRREGHPAHYGDVASHEVLDLVAQVSRARVVVFLLSDPDAARRAVAVTRTHWPTVRCLVRAHRAGHDEVALAGPMVEVVSEDLETALEIVERVMHRVDGPAPALASALSAARRARGPHGERQVAPESVVAGMSLDAVVLVEGAPAVGRSLVEAQLRQRDGALVVALSRAGCTVTAPDAQERLRAGDVLFLAGTRDQLHRSRELLCGA